MVHYSGTNKSRGMETTNIMWIPSCSAQMRTWRSVSHFVMGQNAANVGVFTLASHQIASHAQPSLALQAPAGQSLLR